MTACCDSTAAAAEQEVESRRRRQAGRQPGVGGKGVKEKAVQHALQL